MPIKSPRSPVADSQRRTHSSASPFEPVYGYSRAVRVGDRIDVAGCAPIEPDGASTVGDAGVQAARCLTIIGEALAALGRSEEHTSELQSLMRISYAVFCLKKNKKTQDMTSKGASKP